MERMIDVAATVPLAEPTVASSSRRVAFLNRLLTRSWAGGMSSRPSLDPAALIAAAERRTHLADWGEATFWRGNLDVLTRALHHEARLSPLGVTLAYGQLLGALCNRLHAQRLWTKHPEILEQRIAAPIVVLGQMRSGTTRVQRLLAQDARFTHTRCFESWNPIPRARFDERRMRGWMGLTAARLINPHFNAIHPTGVSRPDEEIGLHGFSLFGSIYEAQWRMPSFAAHCQAMDTRPVYAEFKRLLQTLSWLRGETGARPYILKVPQFTQDLDALLATFPDARLVCLDRPLDKLVASSASLVRNQMVVQSDAVDPHWIGREWLRKIRLRQARTAAVRSSAQVPQIDLSFEAVTQDWRGAMAGVYATLDVPFGAEVEARMAAYVRRSEREPLGRHRYTLAEFGLNAADLTAA